MKAKAILAVGLLPILCFSYAVAGESNHNEKPISDDAKAVASPDSTVMPGDSSVAEKENSTGKIVIYYFHGNRRCKSCKKIEAYTREAIETSFGTELENGTMEWLPVNTEQDDNEHFIEDYKLYTKSVIVSRIENEKETEWKNLEKVWRLLNDKDSFIKYITDEVQAFKGKK